MRNVRCRRHGQEAGHSTDDNINSALKLVTSAFSQCLFIRRMGLGPGPICQDNYWLCLSACVAGIARAPSAIRNEGHTCRAPKGSAR